MLMIQRKLMCTNYKKKINFIYKYSRREKYLHYPAGKNNTNDNNNNKRI